MAKKERQKKSISKLSLSKLRKDAQVKRQDSLGNLLDEKNIALALFECLRDNKPDGIIIVLEIYLDALNKSHLLNQAKIPRSTLYNLLKTRNPTIKTLAKAFHACYTTLKHAN